jgi:membrane-associated protease RseP (regulator of RpoE activity)
MMLPSARFGMPLVIAAALLAATARGDEPRQPPAFQPGDISIGEPIALPFSKPTEPARDQTQPAAGPTSVLTPGTTAPAAAAPATAPQAFAAVAPAGSGWLGMTVAESRTPGRWSIVEVAPRGPAAVAGLAAGDDITSIDGVVPHNADEVSQAITAIAAGQRVRLAIARGEQMSDVEVVATPRPAVLAARERTPALVPTTPPPATAPTAAQAAPAATSVLTPPPPFQPPPFQPPQVAPGPAQPAVAPGLAQPAAPPVATTVPTPPPAAVPWSGVAQPATVAAPPRRVSPPPTGRGRAALGVRTVPIDADTRARFRLGDEAGAYVIGVVGDLPASRAGIPPGSVIVRLNGQPVRSPDELTTIVTSGPVDRPIPVDFVLQPLEAPLERALLGDAAPQPTAVPVLQDGGPRTSRRPVAPVDEAGDLRREVGRLRGLLEALERRLERLAR